MTSQVHTLDIPADAEIVLPPHGFFHLQAYLASDLDVVNAARVSLGKQTNWIWACDGEIFPEEEHALSHRDTLVAVGTPEDAIPILGPVLAENDEGVLRFLLRARHGSPFEHNYFRAHVRAPIFVFREWHRHRIGFSYNEESARYSPLKGDFYIPERDHIREQHGKPGAYTFERIEDDDKAAIVQQMLANLYEDAFETYQSLMGMGVAKELARAVLPVGIYSQMIVSFNARSAMNFLSLRNHQTALREIRVYAEALERVLAQTMPITYDEFVKNGRVAP